jgi:four helix bundle protein
MKSHKDLDVWKAAIGLAKEIYRVTGDFPKSEIFGMTAQMRRSAVSIASNIAEGAARRSNREFIQFLYVALGSAAEVETQLVIAREVALCQEPIFKRLDRDLAKIRQMLHGLVRSVAKT